MGTWSTETAMSSAAYDGAAAVHGDSIYIFGGNNLTTNTRAYNTITHTWSTKATIPIFTVTASATTLGDYIYLWGSYGASNSPRVCRRYHPATDSWSTTAVADLPVDIFGIQAVTDLMGYIWVMGLDDGLSSATFAGRAYRYNPSTNTWSTPVTTGLYAQEHKRAVLGGDGNIYLMGAFPGTNTHQMIDTSTFAVSSKTVLPAVRWGGSVGTRGSFNYYTTGNQTSSNSSPQTTHYAFDVTTNTWSTKTAIPQSRRLAYHVTKGSEFYIIGGIQNSTQLATNSVWTEPQLLMGTASAEGSATTSAAADFPPATVGGSAEVVAGALDATFKIGMRSGSLINVSATGEASFDSVFAGDDIYASDTLYVGGDF